MDRNLSGVYVRTNRNNKWESVDITDLTNDEMDDFLNNSLEPENNYEKEYVWVRDLCKILSKTIRKIGNEFDIIKGD